jgi:hypothetical protein
LSNSTRGQLYGTRYLFEVCPDAAQAVFESAIICDAEAMLKIPLLDVDLKALMKLIDDAKPPINEFKDDLSLGARFTNSAKLSRTFSSVVLKLMSCLKIKSRIAVELIRPKSIQRMVG